MHFLRQQGFHTTHQKQTMPDRTLKNTSVMLFTLIALFISGCTAKSKIQRARLLETSDATTAEIEVQIQKQASIDSIRSKMYLEFQDNSYAEVGTADKYKKADATVVVQRPSKILFKVEVPFIGTDIAEMSSDGEHFRIAVLNDGSNGNFLSFLKGTNARDYSRLSESAEKLTADENAETKQNIKAFSNLRPQHIIEALLMEPLDKNKFSYSTSTIIQEEYDLNARKDSPTKWVLRGFYLLDEFEKGTNGELKIRRRFWFDRVGGVNLSRLQIFGPNGEIASNIVYGKFGDFEGTNGVKLPLEVTLTRPKEKYQILLTHKEPSSVKINVKYPERAFILENTNKLREVDLDAQLDQKGKSQTIQSKP